MPSNTKNPEILKNILEKSHQSQFLDSHPWTRSLVVRQASADMPDLLKKSPGQRLVLAIAKIFMQMMPANPPRQGKRLDTHWGEFGLLAAQYFAPLIYGEPVPGSLREAWGRIDQSILLFVNGNRSEALSESEKELYRLVGNEANIAPNSTLSDWHTKGLKRLAEIIQRREIYLSEALHKSAVITNDNASISSTEAESKLSGKWRFVTIFIGILLLGLLVYEGLRSWNIYKQAVLVRQEVTQLRALTSTPGSKLNQIKAAGPALSILRQDFETFTKEIEPFLLAGKLLKWVPVYGGDLASAQTMANMANSLLASADISYESISPLLVDESGGEISPTRLAEVLVKNQDQLIEASRQINLAKTDRSHLSINGLSPDVQNLVINELDPLITFLGDGLSVAEDLPRLLGATGEGPKSYLFLAENEDELRPTGGFITAVGTLLVDRGQISDLTFVNSYDLDNWSKPYPAAPWQLQQYMDTSVLVLRDTSWFTNYPTAALYAETLFSYANSHTVDGVIAFDQQFLVKMLEATGPIELAGVTNPIGASNVIAYLRTIKTPYAADRASDVNDATGMSKAIFMKEIADVMVKKIVNGDVPVENLVTSLFQALNEHHLLLKIDSQSITEVLAQHRWDGAVRPEGGDFLMVTDTNVGFNKTNVVVQSSLVYDIDLTKPASPSSSLTIVHKNNAAAVICKQAGYKPNPPPGEEKYLITDCYWNYMRIYTPGGAKLIDATPQFIPANWMIVKQDVPARVDNLDENIAGIQAFGTLQVVPGGESMLTIFHFTLPGSIIQSNGNHSVYHLLVQKQPGTQAVPITIRVHLPNNVLVKAVPAGAIVQNPNILYQTNLQTDVKFDIAFQVP